MSSARPYHRLTAFDRLANRLLAGLGRGPTLAVPGRRTGKWHAVPVWPVEHEGTRYVVAPRGDTHWARTLRASGVCELRQGRQVERFRAVELTPDEAAPIVRLYVDRYGRRYGGFVAREFEQMPDPRDHPVFRIEPQQ